MTDDRKRVIAEFKPAVNMTARQLAAWLETEESRKVGYKKEGAGESIGHDSGRRIVQLLAKKQADYDDEDLKHMAKVAGYVHRHLAQRPDGDVAATPWRHSLMNWGHDPEKKPRATRKSRTSSSA